MKKIGGKHRSRVRSPAALALGLALALGSCREKAPALVLGFDGLPPEATGLSVDLSSSTWSFQGADVSDGRVAVRYVGGRLRIEIDRSYLVQRGDRLRLGLAVPRQLSVDASAQATVGQRQMRAATQATAAPDKDLALTFVFADVPDAAIPGPVDVDDGGVNPAPDARAPDGAALVPGADASRDASRDTAPDATEVGAADLASDLSGAETGPPDASASPDLPADLPAPAINCTVGPLYPASVSSPSSDPSIAFMGGIFAIAWMADSSGSRILYNAVDRDGALQHRGGDTTLVPAESPYTYSHPRLASNGTGILALSYGRRDTVSGNAGVAMRLIHPGNGMAAGAFYASAGTASEPPDLGGMTYGTHFAVASRAGAMAATPARLDLADRSLVPVKSLSPAAFAATRSTSITWAPLLARYAVASIVDSGAKVGTIATFDAELNLDKTFPFTGAGALPNVTSAGTTVSVAAGRDRLAVAWIDSQSCDGCMTDREVFLSLVDATSGFVTRTAVSNDRSPLPKLFPHVAFDGNSYVVLWSEYLSTTSSRVRLRRYDQDLRPLGATVEVSASAPSKPVGGIDLAVEARNTYGVVMTLHTDKHHFTRIVCTGP